MVIIVTGASLGRSQLALKRFNVALPRIRAGTIVPTRPSKRLLSVQATGPRLGLIRRLAGIACSGGVLLFPTLPVTDETTKLIP